MTDEFERELAQIFKASDVDLSKEDFASGVMVRVRKNQRRSRIFGYAMGTGLLVIAWVLMSFVAGSTSEFWAFPGEAILSAGSGQPLASLPVLFLACMAAAGYLLLDLES